MDVEIERRFLVKNTEWEAGVACSFTISQGYIAKNEETVVRVRVSDLYGGHLAIKTNLSESFCNKFEYEIPMSDAESLLSMAKGRLGRTRYIVTHGDLVWEVDVFHSDNEGLIIAKVKLPSVDTTITLPTWIGEEITGVKKYSSASLIQQPLNSW